MLHRFSFTHRPASLPAAPRQCRHASIPCLARGGGRTPTHINHCVSSSSGGVSGGGGGPTKEVLQQQLQAAVSAEDYSSAANIQQQIKELELQDPLHGLQLALAEAVEQESYEDAARLRDQIKELQELVKQQNAPDMQGIATTSDTLTAGIRVNVRSYYVPAQSRPELGQFFFAYGVRITNEGQQTVMLKSRHWIITDGTGKVDHVRGPGVVGEQPVLEPGKSFEYQSACPLFTSSGTMEGEYTMQLLQESGEWGAEVQVAIGRFALLKPDAAA